MIKQIVKSILVVYLLFFVVGVMPTFAAPDLGMENYVVNLDLADYNDQEPRDVIIDVVKYLMTFLGIIAVIIILWGGFRWMTAAGNEDKVSEAKKIIIAGAIGLVIILAAYAIVSFVVGMTTDALTE